MVQDWLFEAPIRESDLQIARRLWRDFLSLLVTARHPLVHRDRREGAYSLFDSSYMCSALLLCYGAHQWSMLLVSWITSIADSQYTSPISGPVMNHSWVR